MKTLKALLVVALVFSCVQMALAGGKAESAEQKGPVQLKFTLWSGNEAHLKMFNAIAAEYNKKNPNVSVKFLTIPHSSYLEKVTLMASGSDAPDAGWLFERVASAFTDAGALLDLRKDLDQWEFADFTPSAMSLWVRDKAVYGVPFSTSPVIIFYNSDLFAAAGVPTPDALKARGEWTWDKFREVARTIKTKTGKYAYQVFPFDDDPLRVVVPTVRAYGGDVWDDKGNCTINTPQAVKAVQLYHDMLFADQSIVPPANMSDFFNGDVGMYVYFLSAAAKLKGVNWKWGIIGLPSGPAGEVSTLGQSAIVAFSAGRNRKIATDFVGFLTNKQNISTMSEFFPPIRVSVLESDKFLNGNPAVPAAMMKSVMVPAMKIGVVLPVHENYAKLVLSSKPHFDRLWRAGADVAGTLNAMQKELQPLLK